MRRFGWSWPDETPERTREGVAVARALNAPDAFGRALANRGIGTSRTSDLVERPLRECTAGIGDPDGVEEAAGRLLDLGRKGRLGVICDFDVDGATAQAILIETLRAVLPDGAGDPVVTVPHRNTEGFGPNVRCLNHLSEKGVTGVAVLDCGTSAGRLLDRFHESTSIETVVVDHHPPHHLRAPESGCLVNPWVRRAGDPKEQGTLCTAGLAWFLARSMLRQAGCTASGTAPLRKRLTLLAALGTLCDVMPVDAPFNRSLVQAGVRLLSEPAVIPPGLRALVDLAGLRGKPRSEDLNWKIGPRLNAGSRMGKSSLAARCLREEKPRTARELAKQLHELNHERRELGRQAAKELDSSVGLEALAEGPVNVHRVSAATPGTVGLVAGSLVRRFGWPSLAVAERDDDILAGSGRAALGFNLGAAVSDACQEGILVSGGGHAAACGVTLKPSRVKDLESFLRARFVALSAEDGRLPEPTHRIDAALSGKDLASESLFGLAKAQERFEPWGQGLEGLVFGVRACTLKSSNMTGKGHLFLTLSADGTDFPAVWWSVPQDWRQRAGLNGSGDAPGEIDIAGEISLDNRHGLLQGRMTLSDLRASAQ